MESAACRDAPRTQSGGFSSLSTLVWFALLAALVPAGCQSPYHQDQDALAGGVVGGAAGAIIGHGMGNTAAGALVGAGVGAVTGAAIGHSVDESEARQHAFVEQQLGRAMAGAVSVPDAVDMTRHSLDEIVIINQIRTHGAVPLTSPDLIYLQQQGVSPRVIAEMQSHPVMIPPPGVVAPPGVVYPGGPPPVVIEGGYYRPYYYRRSW